MSKDYDILIAVLGWEDRFIKGIIDDLDNHSIQKIILINYNVKAEYTKDHKVKLEQLCIEKSIELIELNLNYEDSVVSWHEMSRAIPDKVKNASILIDITTIPRETIWSLFHFCWPNSKNIDFVYHKPLSYSNQWLTKEPGKPRLLFKHSGIQKLNYPTALFIITGFELERAKQLVYYYEPKVTYLAIQTGSQFDNLNRNQDSHRALKEICEIKEIKIDAYSADLGLSYINKVISEIKSEHNVVVASLGPKPTAISIYHTYLMNTGIALAYVPNKDFNVNYSEGIGEKIYGTVKKVRNVTSGDDSISTPS